MSRCLPLVPQERTLVWHAPKNITRIECYGTSIAPMSAFTKSQSQFVPKAPKAEVLIALTPIAAGLQRLSHRCISLLLVEERARHRKGAQVAGQPELVHAVAVRANMRSILAAMMKSFSCSPLIFLVCRETVALPQPKLIFG